VNKNKIHKHLNDLRTRRFLAQGKDPGQPLMETSRTIWKFSKMAPPAFVGEQFRVSYLRGVVLGYPWAT